MERQLLRVAQTLARSPFLLNPAVLTRLENVVEAELVVFRSDGSVVAGNSGAADGNDDKALIPGALMDGPAGKVLSVRSGTEARRALWLPVHVPGYGEVRLGLVKAQEEAEQLKRDLLGSLAAIAVLGVMAAVLAGTLIARRVTVPLEELVEAATSAAEGGRERRVAVRGTAEIARLAEAFNTMMDRLTASEKRLVEAERLTAAGETAAELAHEIRNPLTGIKMLLQVLNARCRGVEDMEEILGPVLEEVIRLENVVRRTLDRTRAVVSSAQPLSLAGLVEDVIHVAKPRLRAQKIEVETVFSPEEILVRVDGERMKQVLWNLLENARQAMPDGGRLTVTVRPRERNEVEIVVEDTGGGIPPGGAEVLSEPFFTTKEEGLGLGLFLSRRIVEWHGGRLVLEPRQGGGTRAVVRLALWSSEVETGNEHHFGRR